MDSTELSLPSPAELVIATLPELSFAGELLRNALGRAIAEQIGKIAGEGYRAVPLFGASYARLLASLGPDFAELAHRLASLLIVRGPYLRLQEIAEALLGAGLTESAFVKPPAFSPVNTPGTPPRADEPPEPTVNFTTLQGYLDPSPDGVDARFAWTLRGGGGLGVNVVDVESEWRFSHEDLTQNLGGVIAGAPPGDLRARNHGTAVIGIFGGDRNAMGVTGIAPEARAFGASIYPTADTGFTGLVSGSASAIRRAADMLTPGDIILVELHYPGPRFNFTWPRGDNGYIPVEWWPDNLLAIQYATAKGVIVVEAAGNGSENLDDPLYDTSPARPPFGPFPSTWSNPFRRGAADSGAILVGAGAPPTGTDGSPLQGRIRLGFSNFGSALDAQGWGSHIVTCGYGSHLAGGTNEDRFYTNEFGGTSGAAPIIAGVLACIQGALDGAGKPRLKPSEARNLLRRTGVRQPDEAAGRIGNLPDLRDALRDLGIG